MASNYAQGLALRYPDLVTPTMLQEIDTVILEIIIDRFTGQIQGYRGNRLIDDHHLCEEINKRLGTNFKSTMR